MEKPQHLGLLMILLLVLAQTAFADAWVASSGVSPMTDRQWFTLSVTGQPGLEGDCPILGVSCLDHENVVALYSPWPVQPSVGEEKRQWVRLRFDNAPPREERWLVDDDRHTLMAPNPLELATVLQGSDRLLVEFTTIDDGRRVVEIPISGFSTDRGNLWNHCSWGNFFAESMTVTGEPISQCSLRSPTFPDNLRKMLQAVPTQFDVIVRATVDGQGRLVHPSVAGGENPPNELIQKELLRAAKLSLCESLPAGESVNIRYRYQSDGAS